MVGPSPILSPINEEFARLKWFEGFMHKRWLLLSCLHHVIPTKSIIRVELEQNMYVNSTVSHGPGADCPERISGLQVLLEGASPLPERKLLWHCALEKLLDGTRDGSNLILGD